MLLWNMAEPEAGAIGKGKEAVPLETAQAYPLIVSKVDSVRRLHLGECRARCGRVENVAPDFRHGLTASPIALLVESGIRLEMLGNVLRDVPRYPVATL